MDDPEIKLMNLKVDFAFKQLFGKPQSADMLMAFLNALLHRTGTQAITSVEFFNSEFAGDHESDRGARLDVYVRTGAGEFINVEIQLASQKNIPKRTLFYWATIFKAQIRKNNEWQDLPQMITINIVNFTLFHSTNRYHTSYHVYEDVEHFRLSDVLEIHFVEMTKFRDLYRTQLSVCLQDALERWLLLLDASEQEGIRTGLEAIAMSDSTMEKALDLWGEISRDPDNWAAYISRDKELRDLYNLQRQAEDAFDEGRQEGRQEGRKEGRQEANLETARNLLSSGLSIEQIVKATGLSVSDVTKLQEERPC